VHNLRVNPDVEIRDETVVRPMRVREVEDEDERSRLWKLAIAAYPPYAEYQVRTAWRIPVFVARAVLARSPPRASPMIARHSPREASCGKLIWSSRAGCRMSWH
jgi:hypothetical protein